VMGTIHGRLREIGLFKVLGASRGQLMRLFVYEAVMMGLGPMLGRNYAHDLVYDICREVVKTGRPLIDLLAENKEIAKHANRKTLEALVDPANYLGVAGEMVDRVLKMRKT